MAIRVLLVNIYIASVFNKICKHFGRVLKRSKLLSILGLRMQKMTEELA